MASHVSHLTAVNYSHPVVFNMFCCSFSPFALIHVFHFRVWSRPISIFAISSKQETWFSVDSRTFSLTSSFPSSVPIVIFTMITWTSVITLFTIIHCISGSSYIHSDSLPKALDELLGLFNCSVGTQTRIQKCLYEMYDDINDYNTWHSSNRVHCCIVAKFQDCVLEDNDDSCKSSVEFLSPRSILVATSCMDYDQDSFECHLFFHREAYFFGFIGLIFVISVICVCVATKPKTRRATVTTVRTSTTSLEDLPPSYDKVHLNFPEKLEKFWFNYELKCS